jgi:hypothetical protein
VIGMKGHFFSVSVPRTTPDASVVVSLEDRLAPEFVLEGLPDFFVDFDDTPFPRMMLFSSELLRLANLPSSFFCMLFTSHAYRSWLTDVAFAHFLPRFLCMFSAKCHSLIIAHFDPCFEWLVDNNGSLWYHEYMAILMIIIVAVWVACRLPFDD